MRGPTLPIAQIKADSLAQILPGLEPISSLTSVRLLTDWEMARDDAPIMREIIRWMQPRRHLEFGTWKGYGACLVMENSSATVWTINLWGGEFHAGGMPAYSESFAEQPSRGFWQKMLFKKHSKKTAVVQTDAKENIGVMIQEKQFGHRVNHVFCDSKLWDTSAYPSEFFDTVLIDGGHQTDVVACDTRKALPLLREGGVILWHDFCLDEQVRQKFKHVETVIQGVESVAEEIHRHGIRLYWINPSWLLCGIKGNAPVPTAKS